MTTYKNTRKLKARNDKGLGKKLRTYRIRPKRYKEEKAVLESLDYTPEQIDRLIIRKSSQTSMEVLIEYHSRLVDRYHLTHEEIFKMASSQTGSKKMEAFVKYYDDLKSKDFSVDQVISMVSGRGADRRLGLVCENFQQLQDSRFTVLDIVRIVSYKNGHKLIKAVIDNLELFRHLEFTVKRVVTLVCACDGEKRLAHAIRKAVQAAPVQVSRHSILMEDYHLTHAQIFKMVSSGAGLMKTQAFIEYYVDLERKGFSVDQIISMVSGRGAYKSLGLVYNNFQKLHDSGFTVPDIVGIVSYKCGTNHLNAVIENLQLFRDLGCSVETAITFVRAYSCRRRLTQVIKAAIKAASVQGITEISDAEGVDDTASSDPNHYADDAEKKVSSDIDEGTLEPQSEDSLNEAGYHIPCFSDFPFSIFNLDHDADTEPPQKKRRTEEIGYNIPGIPN